VLRSLLVRDRASFTGENVFRSSQSALCTTAVGSESLYLWSDSLLMARTLTFLHGETGFPGVEEPSDSWYSVFRMRRGIQL